MRSRRISKRVLTPGCGYNDDGVLLGPIIDDGSPYMPFLRFIVKRITHAKFCACSTSLFEYKLSYRSGGRGGLVVRSRLWGRRAPGSRPNSTEDPSCMGPVAR
ncbi:hypothetical protein AVEN_65092-1 [Araneus ventricosus]|uniref:Uncharacterized protein n=1 Tax=Araneus ventricosus TaxID=182803 RepID=A0A4Y2SFY3_ARAVE|nr:hypothetical protein AVEN_79359-1 [Araneus ventricosus]GBN82152.1 hypothetical protein AVEN_150345-1 [Araneus ventricosus]GBN87152.1 hypothetical protein AVEN_209670-1 [Araneus ventricosus]GBN87154.1 hypothetical protein AVEN_65092-1 [Araneus ventricosus]